MMHPSAVGLRFNKPICPNGHDKRIVGVTSSKECRECKRRRPRIPYRFVNPYCKHGHDKRIVGVKRTGSCAECHRAIDRNRNQKKARRNPKSLHHARAVTNLRQVRKELGLSVAALSRLSGISRKTLDQWERGEQKAWPENQAKLLQAIAPILRERKYERMSL
jgi:DNA-binding transcriptional regulator YiaG